MSEIKELGKFEVVPTTDQLMAVVEFFEKHATEMGRINFTQRQMIEHPVVAAQFNTPSYLNGVNTYLANEGFITKVDLGRGKGKAIWDVNKLLSDWDKVETREVLGTSRPVRNREGKIVNPNSVAVEVVRSEDRAVTPKEERVIAPKATTASKGNTEILVQLQDAMSDMMGYLQNLPVEMSGHLRSISDQLELTDENALKNLQEEKSSLESKIQEQEERFKAEKKDLEDEVRRLNTELEEVSSKTNCNTHQIYRQRNSIMDEIDRMITGPSWTIRQNGTAIRNNIESKLDAIMKEIGIEVNK